MSLVNEEMEVRADRIRTEFPPPAYSVELHDNERSIWVKDNRTQHTAVVGEHDFEMDPEGPAEIEYIRTALS